MASSLLFGIRGRPGQGTVMVGPEEGHALFRESALFVKPTAFVNTKL